jgi:hypothetical protein
MVNMKTLRLLHVAQTDTATYGVLLFEGVPFTLTLELPWKDNQHNISRIPTATYQVKRVNSPTHGNVFQVQDVPNRGGILLHKGNIPKDTLGCILVGEQFETVNGVPGIAASSIGFGQFMALLKDDNEFTLEIKDVF